MELFDKVVRLMVIVMDGENFVVEYLVNVEMVFKQVGILVDDVKVLVYVCIFSNFVGVCAMWVWVCVMLGMFEEGSDG